MARLGAGVEWDVVRIGLEGKVGTVEECKAVMGLCVLSESCCIIPQGI